MRNPDFPRYAFWNESLKRFTTAAAHRGGGIFYYIPVFLGGFFPWSLFLLLAGWNRLRRWRELRQEAGRPILFLLTLGGMGIRVLLDFAFQASHLFSARNCSAQHPDGTGLAGSGEGSRSAPAGLADRRICPVAGRRRPGGRRVALVALSRPLTCGWPRSLPPASLELIQPSLLYTGLILAAMGFLGRRIWPRKCAGERWPSPHSCCWRSLFPMLVLRWYAPLKLLAESHSSRSLAATILASPERDSPIYGYYYFRTSLPFYLRRPVGLLSVEWGEMTSNYQVARQEEARRVAGGNPGKGFWSRSRNFVALTKSNPQPILVMTPNTSGGKPLGDCRAHRPAVE